MNTLQDGSTRLEGAFSPIKQRVLQRFLGTDGNWGETVARVSLGAVMIPHGAQKLLGLFGGPGFRGTMGWFTEQAGIPAPIAFLVILAESLGAAALVMGIAGRFMAGGIAVVMVGAIFMGHLQNGFFMNWFGTMKGEGFEYHLLAIALALVVVVRGSGAFSVDRWLFRRFLS